MGKDRLYPLKRLIEQPFTQGLSLLKFESVGFPPYTRLNTEHFTKQQNTFYGNWDSSYLHHYAKLRIMKF